MPIFGIAMVISRARSLMDGSEDIGRCPRRSMARPPTGCRRLVHEGADVDDPLALLARDLRPVVGVGRVGQVLVLLVLLVDRRDEVLGADAPLAAGDLRA